MREISRVVSGTNSIQREGWEDGEYYCETEFFDKKQLDQNNRIRNSGMLDDSKLGLHFDEDIRMAISCPSTLQWSIFCKKNADTYKLLTSSTSEADRMKGARQLQILHPDWVVFDRL